MPITTEVLVVIGNKSDSYGVLSWPGVAFIILTCTDTTSDDVDWYWVIPSPCMDHNSVASFSNILDQYFTKYAISKSVLQNII